MVSWNETESHVVLAASAAIIRSDDGWLLYGSEILRDEAGACTLPAEKLSVSGSLLPRKGVSRFIWPATREAKDRMIKRVKNAETLPDIILSGEGRRGI